LHRLETPPSSHDEIREDKTTPEADVCAKMSMALLANGLWTVELPKGVYLDTVLSDDNMQ
jgi:hypothetical protein